MLPGQVLAAAAAATAPQRQRACARANEGSWKCENLREGRDWEETNRRCWMCTDQISHVNINSINYGKVPANSEKTQLFFNFFILILKKFIILTSF